MNDITLPRGAPEFEEVSQADRTHKRQHGCPVIGGADNDEDTRQCRQDGQGFMHRRPYKRQHQG